MTICDANYIIRHRCVDIGAYEQRNDGGIFNDSDMGKVLDKNI